MTAATKPFPVSFADIKAAAKTIAPAIVLASAFMSAKLTGNGFVAAVKTIAGAIEATPARYSHTLSAIAGAEIFVKFENLQFTASFKERGALNKLLSLDEESRKRGVIAMSAGNHAQGVAYHAG